MKILKFSFVMVAALLMLASCSKRGGQSGATGWNYNDSDWGGFDVRGETDQPAAPGLVFIEGGTFTMGRVAEDPHHAWDNIPHTATVSSFYLDECEVSNRWYLEFEYWMRRAYSEEYPEKIDEIMPDTACWRDKLAWREGFVNYYYRSPAFADYPVVGVTWEQASAYCIWRTDRLNEKVLVDRGIIALDQENLGTNAFQTDVYLAGAFEGEGNGVPNLDPGAGGESRNVRREDGILYPNYRLPTEAEWEFAALGMIGDTYDERVTEHKTYPWAGQSLRSANKKYYGQFLANFKRSRGDAMGVAGNLNDGWEYTCPVKWYFPNDYGLYNMAGNVSEWCGDVFRKVVNPLGGEDINPFRGNVYRTVVYDEDGEVQMNEDGTLVYDDEEVSFERRNYRQANNINYLDGDRSSNLDTKEWQDTSSARMDEIDPYELDSLNDVYTNKMYRRQVGDSKEDVSSLINNRVRVIKGGSWKDREYYLQVSTRRYYDQDKSTAWIGFRCAMDRLGSRVK